MQSLNGKVVLVTGAASGIGLAEAELLVQAGARVVMTDLNIEPRRQRADVLGANALLLSHDVADAHQWRAVIEAAVAHFGRLDGVINNAGIYQPASIIETTPELFNRHVAVNQRGTFLGMQAAAKHFIKVGRGGVIVNTSSVCGVKGYPGILAYTSTKWAVRGMTRSAAAELAPHGIRVNAILPGFVQTPILGANSEEANAEGAKAAAVGRMGEPAEVAALARYLVSDDSAFVTGADFLIDGGLSL